MKRKSILYTVLAVAAVAVTVWTLIFSKNKDGYINVIPNGCKAIMAIDFQKMADGPLDRKPEGKPFLDVLGVEEYEDCGVDFSRKAFLFETSDGSLGIVAAVDSEHDMDDWMQKLVTQGKASNSSERKGFKFVVVNDNFLVGYSSSALLVMGPAVGDGQALLQRKMVRYLSSDKDGVSTSPLYQRLSTMDAPMAIVAQADALPDKLVKPLALGVPKGVSNERLYIAATLEMSGGCLTVRSHTFSSDRRVDEALKASLSKLNPVSDKYLSTISSENLLTVASSVKGGDFVELLRTDEFLRTLLMGINTTIDIDKMLRGVDGDLIVSFQALSGDNIPITLLADAKDVSWQKDVEYWKKSCPAGTVIDDAGKCCWHVSGKQLNAWFGVNDEGVLYFVPRAEDVATLGDKASSELSPEVVSHVKGSRFVAILNMGLLGRKNPELSVVSALLPGLKTIVMKVED